MASFLKKFFLSLLLLGLCAGVAQAQESTKIDVILIQTAEKDIQYNVMMAREPRELRKGLMHRRSLAPYDGMLFDFGREKDVRMWMKNTYIPLDMAFINNDGKIVYIRKNTVPLSEDPIISKRKARSVLEVEAGTLDRDDIHVGDMVVHSLFVPKPIIDPVDVRR